MGSQSTSVNTKVSVVSSSKGEMLGSQNTLVNAKVLVVLLNKGETLGLYYKL